jgi:RNA polymerase sigma factor (sigma-70 family)
LEDLNSILKGCIVNDHKYQKIFYEQYYNYAFKIAFRYIYHYDKIPEVVNDGFVKIFRSFSNYNIKDEAVNEYNLLAWVKKIIIHTAIDELRKNNLMPEIGAMPDEAWEVSDQQGQADQVLLYKEILKQVKSLPPAYRAVFNLYVVDGYSHKEIAALMNISVGASKSNLFKAKAHLQKILKKDSDKMKYAISE